MPSLLKQAQMCPAMTFKVSLRRNWSHNRPSGIDCLAPETVALIFTLASFSSSGSEDGLSLFYNSTIFPILISHVSQRWRQIAISTSTLWRTLVVCGPFSTTSHLPHLSRTRICQRLDAFLTRSSRQPLRIYLDFRDPSWSFALPEDSHPSSFDPSLVDSILEKTVAHCHRWEDVEVLSDTWSPLHAFLRCCNEREVPPKLRRIALARCNAYFVLEGIDFAPVALKESFSLFRPGEADHFNHRTIFS